MSKLNLQLFLLGISHQSATLESLETFKSKKLDFHSLLTTQAQEFFILSTCNRFELYYVAEKEIEPASILGLTETTHNYYKQSNYLALRHFMQVCSGLESEMIGETEILGQSKQAYLEADKAKLVGKVLHKFCQKSFQSAKWIRTHTAISQGQVSLGNVSVDLASRIFGSLKKSQVMVIGSGQVGADVAKAFKSRGVNNIRVSSRTKERTQALVKEVEGEEIEYLNWQNKLIDTDILVCCTSSKDILLEYSAIENLMQKRPDHPLFLIDLAVPGNISPQADDESNVFLYQFSDLAEISNRNLKQRENELDHCKTELSSKAEQIWKSIETML